MAPDHDQSRGGGTSPWEWLIASISALLVAATIGYLIYDALGQGTTPPLIEIRADSIIAAEGSYIVELQLRNTGRTTAARLTIEGTLLHGDTAVQTSTTTLDYLPARSERRAALIFSHDPGRYRLHLRPTGYTHP